MEILRGHQHEDDPMPEPIAGTLLRIVEIPSEFPTGQTAAERVKAILDAAGIRLPDEIGTGRGENGTRSPRQSYAE